MKVTCFNCEKAFNADIKPEKVEFEGYKFGVIDVSSVDVEKNGNVVSVKCPHCGKTMTGEVE